MRYFLPRTVLLMIVWAALQGAFTPLNLVAGALLGILVLLFVRPLYGEVEAAHQPLTARAVIRQIRRIPWLVELLTFFLYELTRSSLQVAATVLRPTMRLNPGVIALPIDAKSGLEITTLANLISLTPGTLSLEVAPDQDKLYIHAMFVSEDEAETRDYIKRTLERRVIRALGTSEGPG